MGTMVYVAWSDMQRPPVLSAPARRLAMAMQPHFKAGSGEPVVLNRAFDTLFNVIWKTCSDYLEGSIFVRDHLVAPYNHVLRRHPSVAQRPLSRDPPLRMAYVAATPKLHGAYAPGKLYGSWWEGHDRCGTGDAEVSIYALSPPDPPMDALFRSFKSVRVVPCYTWPEMTAVGTPSQPVIAALADRLGQQCARDKIDVAIFTEVSSIFLGLMHRRIAPIQLFSPMSFVPLLSSGVDGFLLTDNALRDALVMGVPQPMTVTVPFSVADSYLSPPRTASDIALARKAVPAGKIVFGTFARSEKISAPFASAVARILAAVPDGVFFVAGHGESGVVRKLFEAAGCDMARIAIFPLVDVHLYGRMIDVYLETFPICQGLAAAEVMAKGIAVVQMKSPALAAIWENQRDHRAVADTAEDYVAIALRLARDPQLRAEYGEAGRDIVAPIMAIEENSRKLVTTVAAFARAERGSGVP